MGLEGIDSILIERVISIATRVIDQAINLGVKKADQVLDTAVKKGKLPATQARIQSKEIHRKANLEGKKLIKKGEKEIAQTVSTVKNMSTSRYDDLKFLEKLGTLKDSGILTEEEFQEKKKKILSRI